ncbi:hypothetical protein [Jatrophihabitans sp.]|uniref:hypothetical protein n=1 Tax=Jatrophihabitans sp. TaxID=1932789 RepID=UPI002F1DA6FF
MHEVVAAATSLAGAGAVTLPAPSTGQVTTSRDSSGLGAVRAYRSTAFGVGIGTAGGVRAVS